MPVTTTSAHSTAASAATAAAPLRFEAPASRQSRPRVPSSGVTWPSIVPLLIDLLLVFAGGAHIFFLRFPHTGQEWSAALVFHHMAFLALYATLVVIFCQNQGLYQTQHLRGPLDEGFAVLKAVFLATLLLTAIIYLSGDKSISRLVIGFSALLNVILLPAWRLWRCEFVKHRVANDKDGRNVLIVGAGEVGRRLARHFEENKYLGYVVKGFLDANGNGAADVLGDVDELSRLALIHFVDEVFITTPSEHQRVARVVLEARQHRLDVKVVPEMFDGLGWRAPIHFLGDFPVMELLREPIPAFDLFIKRLVDVVGSAVGLVTLAPLLALIAIAIKLDSRGPAVYSSWRVGKKGRRFRCHKFRSMVHNADELKDRCRHLNEREGPCFKIANDPRLTRLGGFLRRYSLDEMPQLWNVLKGEMSLVGPRPHPLDDYARYQIEHLRRLDVKPGITGLWQVYARCDPSFERNLTLDLEYIETWSPWLDTKILLKTVPAALSGSGR